MDKHAQWIAKHYPDHDSAYNCCNEAVRAMTIYFDDLKVQVGRVNGVYHCWCKDLDDNIVDPTVAQFEGCIIYQLIAERFLGRDEIELSTGAIFLNDDDDDLSDNAW